jgi:hypothetical protein
LCSAVAGVLEFLLQPVSIIAPKAAIVVSLSGDLISDGKITRIMLKLCNFSGDSASFFAYATHVALEIIRIGMKLKEYKKRLEKYGGSL